MMGTLLSFRVTSFRGVSMARLPNYWITIITWKKVKDILKAGDPLNYTRVKELEKILYRHTKCLAEIAFVEEFKI